MKIKEIKLNKFKENPWNPNEMTERTFNHLKKEYKRVGFLQPILARPIGDYYEIIDGEHRWKAAKLLGLDTIPAVIVELTDEQAKITTLNMNSIKGSNNPIKYAELLIDLEKKYDIKVLGDLLNAKTAELEAYKLLLSLPEVDNLKIETKDAYSLNFRFEDEGDIFIVKQVFKDLKHKDYPKKLLELCGIYLKHRNEELQ